jgi:hypothetical protein
MFVALLVIFFGYYVIYTNKEMRGKQHLTTTHAQLGAAALAGYLALGIFGSVALHPDFGVLRSNSFVRTAHKYGGRAMTALAWIVCVLGVASMGTSLVFQAAFSVPLLVAGYFVLL